MKHRLRINPDRLLHYARRFGADGFSKFHGWGQSRGHLTVQQVFEIRKEKSPRGAQRVYLNSEELVREITTFSFNAKTEEARVGALTLLEGISYPTASVILHCCVDRSYPILDFRALWSLGIAKPAGYTPAFWCSYVDVCRRIASQHGMTVRDLDMALWAYSRAHQP